MANQIKVKFDETEKWIEPDKEAAEEAPEKGGCIRIHVHRPPAVMPTEIPEDIYISSVLSKLNYRIKSR